MGLKVSRPQKMNEVTCVSVVFFAHQSVVPQKLVLGLLRAEPQVRWRWQDALESKHEKLWSARILVAQS